MNRENNSEYIKKAMWGLVVGTVDALPSDVSKKLLVSVQQTNVDLCIKYAIKKYIFLSLTGRPFGTHPSVISVLKTFRGVFQTW